MKGGAPTGIISTAGFTIVEVMLFLAISGILFVVAMNSLSGKQNDTEFSTGLGTLISQLDSTIGNVSSGYYSVPGNIKCTAQGIGASAIPVVSTSGGTLGQNVGCTFIGEALQFGVTNTSGQYNGEQTYNTYPVVGLQYEQNNAPEETTDLAGARPETISGLVTTTAMPYGLTVAYVKYGTTTVSTQSALFYSDFGAYANSGNSSSLLKSGALNVELAPLPTSPSGYSIVNDIDNLTDSCNSLTGYVCYLSPYNSATYLTPENPPSGMQVCVNSGSTNQSALLTIGGTGNAGSASGSISEITDQLYNAAGCT